MHASAAPRLATGANVASSVEALFVDDRDRDVPGVAIPRPGVHLVVRFGPSARRGLDVHALGGRQSVYRKVLRSGHRTVAARLRLGAAEAVLGAPASALVGRIVALEDLWDARTMRRLFDRLVDARSTFEAGAVLESEIAHRIAGANGQEPPMGLVLAAADRLTSTHVRAVARDLGVSERHLRRVFRDKVGVGPKTFAKLTRFGRAVREARETGRAGWAAIAAAAGYYDQAHLIAEFRAIAGVTPEVLLSELRAAPSIF